MLSVLRAEDTGEVRFQAGPAQSVAQLEVEGKQLGHGRPGVYTVYPWNWQAGSWSEEPYLPHPFLPGLSGGGSQRAVYFLGSRRLWVEGREKRGGGIEV